MYLCDHGKQKSRCRECGGSSYCQHDKIKRFCRECGGSAFCEHNRRKPECKECNGSSICIHNISKYMCIHCGGGRICVHGKRKSRCKECGGSEFCKTPLCNTIGSKKYEGYCVSCFVNNPENRNKPIIRNYKTKEKEVVRRIKNAFSQYNWITDRRIIGGNSQFRPDIILILDTHVIIIEIDEHKHSSYECICENKRIMQISIDLCHKPTILIRFNPDSYIDLNGVKISSCWKLNNYGILTIDKSKEDEWEKRINILIDNTEYWIHNTTDKIIEVIELFY